MKNISILLVMICFAQSYAFAQYDDRSKIIANVKILFDGMKKGDNSNLASIFTEDAQLSSVGLDKNGETRERSDSIKGFIEAVGSDHKEVWNEVIHDYKVLIDGPLAIAWTPYSFYVDDTFSHCGVNVFQLVRYGTEWKIKSITDTRRKTNCEDQ